MLDVKYAFSFFLQKTKPFRKIPRLVPSPLTHAVEVVMCLHIFQIRLQTLLGCLILQCRAGYYEESAVHRSSVGFGGIAAVSLNTQRANTWSLVHVSSSVSLWKHTDATHLAKQSLTFLFGVSVHCLQVL